MKTSPVAIALLIFLFPVAQFSLAMTVSKDEEEIRKIVGTQQQEAWNRHEAKAYASLFTENADCVNVVGWWWKGRAEIEQKLTAAYAFVFRESVLTITHVDVRLLTPTVAIAHVNWTMTGARTPQGFAKVQQGIQTETLMKSDQKWLIAAFQNTTSIPETPFAQGPPPSTANPSVSP
jgi:uncharacterized protein (TIGR02246 family)